MVTRGVGAADVRSELRLRPGRGGAAPRRRGRRHAGSGDRRDRRGGRPRRPEEGSPRARGRPLAARSRHPRDRRSPAAGAQRRRPADRVRARGGRPGAGETDRGASGRGRGADARRRDSRRLACLRPGAGRGPASADDAHGAHRRRVRRHGLGGRRGTRGRGRVAQLRRPQPRTRPSCAQPAGHVLPRAARRRRRAAHPHLSGSGPLDAVARPADLRRLPRADVPDRRARRNAHAGLPSGRGPRRRQGPDDGPSQGHPRPLRVGDVRRGHHHPVPTLVLPVHRTVVRGRPGLLRLPRRPAGPPGLPHVSRRGLARVGRLRRRQPAGPRRLRDRPRDLLRLRIRDGGRTHVDGSPRNRGHARHGRGRCPLHARLRDGALMRVPVSWLREYVDLPPDVSVEELADRLTMLGLKLEAIERAGEDVSGPLVVGRILDFAAEEHSNGKTIRWCRVDVGEGEPRGVVCGAANFAVGDLVPVALPGTTLPGGFEITARKTYGHVSNGMICSARELGLGDDHTGIIVLRPGEAEVGADAADVLQLRDDVIEFEINPDRAYALSLRGVAREAALAYGLAYRDPASGVAAPGDSGGYPVRVDDAGGCDAFAAVEVTGLDPSAPTPRWLARRVQLAGMRPISLAVDVTNYVMLELGQPIHGYDRDRLRGPIVVRRADAAERLTTLDGVERALDADDLVIADDSGPIGLAGVMGGEATEMGAETADIVIEAAHFDPVTVMRAARRHKLPSEASKRFERGVDPTLGALAARRVAELLVEYGGGSAAHGATVIATAADPTVVQMSVDLPAKVAGFAIDHEQTVSALEAVGCAVEVASGIVSATVPPWRNDLTDPHDLVEEVVRIVGYPK